MTHFPCVDAINLVACGSKLQEQQNIAQNTTYTTDPPPQLRVSREQCLAVCGTGMGDINWPGFAQNFGAWLLPWITLMFQIPFGGECKSPQYSASVFCLTMFWRTEPLDDVLSFFVTMGSPALAAYSLQITHLNNRWITTAFSGIKYPNSKYIPSILSAFHHVPIRISHHPPSLHSLIVLPQNDEFWYDLAAGNKTRRWSIPLVMSYVFFIFSVILSVIDSVYSRTGDIGFSIAAIWTFLPPLIIGWLRIGCEPEPSHLRKSLDAANLKARVATKRRDQLMKGPPAIEFMEVEDVDLARKDELRPVPVFNYSRAFVCPLAAELVLGLMKNSAANAEQRIPVGKPTDREVPTWVEGEGYEIRDENRIGTDTEVTEYCTRLLPQLKWNPSSTTPLGVQSPETTGTPNPLLPLHDPRLVTHDPSRWAPGIWKRVAVSTALALGLQWGTTAAAVIIHEKSPPVGLGCRALSFLLYGVAGTLSFFLFLASSVLTHMSRPLQEQTYARPWLRTCQNAGAIICRWLGKCVAIASAVGIPLVCFFQVTGMFDNCFCRSTTFNKGRDSVMILTINYVAGPSPFRIWIGGLILAFSTALLFGFSMYVGKPARR